MKSMIAALTAAACSFVPSLAHAMDARTARVLMKIEPDTRLEQVCDMEAMNRIGKMKAFKPDRAKSDVISPPQHTGDSMKAPGAAFRSRGSWYAFSFECSGTPNHLGVTAFSYKVGDEIPEARWNEYGLWP